MLSDNSHLEKDVDLVTFFIHDESILEVSNDTREEIFAFQIFSKHFVSFLKNGKHVRLEPALDFLLCFKVGVLALVFF